MRTRCPFFPPQPGLPRSGRAGTTFGFAGRAEVERRCSELLAPVRAPGPRCGGVLVSARAAHGLSHPRAGRSGRRRARRRAGRREATCASGNPAPPSGRARVERAPDRRPLGRPSAGHCREGPAGVRLATPQSARQRGDRHRRGRLSARRRAGRSRSPPLRAPRERGSRGRAAGQSPPLERGTVALAWPTARRVRLRAVGAGRDRKARRASPLYAPGPHRRGSRSRPRRRARRRARASSHRASALGAPARPAHGGAVPLRPAGGRPGGLPGGPGDAGRDARDRAGTCAAASRALDPRSGSGTGRHAPRADSCRVGAAVTEPAGAIDLVRRPQARVAGDPRAPERRGRAPADVDGTGRLGQDAARRRGDGRPRRRVPGRCGAGRACPDRRPGSRRGVDRRQTRCGRPAGAGAGQGVGCPPARPPGVARARQLRAATRSSARPRGAAGGRTGRDLCGHEPSAA